MTIPDRVFFVDSVPHAVTTDCFRCQKYDFQMRRYVPPETDDLCLVCNNTRVIIRPPHRLKKTLSERVYCSKVGVAALIRAHKDCCDITVYEAKPDWTESED